MSADRKQQATDKTLEELMETAKEIKKRGDKLYTQMEKLAAEIAAQKQKRKGKLGG